MRRVTTTLAMALCLLGCGSPGAPVELLHFEGSAGACSIAGGYEVDLIADPTYGTVAGDDTKAFGMVSDVGRPIWWPTGYTGRRFGSEVVVYDSDGKEVARTGRQYSMWPPFDRSAAGQRLVACWDRPCDESCSGGDSPSGEAVGDLRLSLATSTRSGNG